MTKEDAIKYLKQLYPNGGHCWLDEQRIEAISMAVKALQEEPVSDIDFEQELYKAFGQVKDFTLGVRIAKRFYDIGKKSREPVSDDLKNAAEKYAFTMSGEDEVLKYDAFIEGAQWQKQKDQSHLVHEHIDPPTFEEAHGEKKKED
jgi:DNA polymerase II large subunit